MDTFPAALILSLCQKYGPMLRVPPGIDGAKVMAAIAANESSTGQNCKPRYEPAYDRGGRYADATQIKLLNEFGVEAAYSYGPWQQMFCNCPGYVPMELRLHPERCAVAFVAHFNNYVVRHCGAASMAEFAQAWNSGNCDRKPKTPGVIRYIADAEAAYASAKGLTHDLA